MPRQWDDYLKSIGVEGLLLTRTREVLRFYETLLKQEIADIFVSEYIDKEGARQYENLWLFSEHGAMEAKLFLREDDFDLAVLRERVDYWRIRKEEYDFTEATTRSRMVLTFKLSGGTAGDLKASQANCDSLRDIMMNHILRNHSVGGAVRST